MAKLQSVYYHIQNSLEVAVHPVQQARHHRLAINLFTSNKLFDLFKDLQWLARNYGFNLLTKLSSYVFQVDTSYV